MSMIMYITSFVKRIPKLLDTSEHEFARAIIETHVEIVDVTQGI